MPAKTATGAAKKAAHAMSAIVEAKRHVEGLMRPGERLQQAFPRIARIVGVKPRRVKQFWQADAKPRADELDALRAARVRASEAAIRAEVIDHAAILDAQAARLASIDPDFHGPEIARLRSLAGRARALAD
jgi:hypothetical protein